MKKAKASLQRTSFSVGLDKEFSADLKRKSLSNSISFQIPLKQSNKKSLLPLAIKEVNPSNYNTTKSNQDFQEIELQLREDSVKGNPKSGKMSQLNDSENTSIPKKKFEIGEEYFSGKSHTSNKKKKNLYKEELPTKLRVSRTEFEPSLKSHFTSTKKEQKDSQKDLNQKEALGRRLTPDEILKKTFEQNLVEEPRNLRVNRSVKKGLKREIDEEDVMHFEEDLMRLKKEIQLEETFPEKSNPDQQSLSSLKVYKSRGMLKSTHGPRKKVNLTFNKLAGIQQNLKKKHTKLNKKMFSQGVAGKLYNTMDDNITRQVKSHFKNLNKIAESPLQDSEEETPEKNLLKWRKNRIKNYGKGKFKKGDSRKNKTKKTSSPKKMKRKSTLSEIKKQWKNKKKEIANSVDLKSSTMKKNKDPEILIFVGGNYSKKSENRDFSEERNFSEKAKTEHKKQPKKSKFYLSKPKQMVQSSLPNNNLKEVKYKSKNLIKPLTPNENVPKTTVSKPDAFHISADSSFEWLMDDKGLPISDMDPSLMNSVDYHERLKKAPDSIREMGIGMSEQWNRKSFNPSHAKRISPISDIRRSLGKKFRVKNDISVEIYGDKPDSKDKNLSKHSADLMIENKLVSQVFDK